MKKTLTAVLAIAALGLAAACGSPAPDDEALVEGERTTQAGPCITRVIYGNTWLNAAGHDRSYFDVRGRVTWDGHCKVNAAGNAYAVLSNGWRPHFKGRTCVIALQQRGACSPVPGRCATRIAYGPAWLPGPSHPARHDDVKWVVTWDGVCHNDGDRSWARLSNGWKPVFRGRNACDLSFRYTQCGGLFANPVIDRDCPDPAVLKDGKTYYMVCTHAPIRSSTDLVHWKWRGKVFTEKNLPAWNKGPFLAPEMHRIGSKYVVYYSSGKGPNWQIGAAWADKPLGPYRDIGRPLLASPPPGVLDATYFRASDGRHYLIWKVDGNTAGKPTPFKIQQLAPNGLSLVGKPKQILTNTLKWEGPLIEGPWMVERNGYVYLFYSANRYHSTKYAVGVARSRSPLGPFVKKGPPILTTKGQWTSPGHGSVVRGRWGAWVHVYHSYYTGKVKRPPGRVVLVDRLQWRNGWPVMDGAPSYRSQPGV